MKKKKTKVKFDIKTNKLNANPLFIKFLNWKEDKYAVELLLKKIKESFNTEIDREYVRRRIENLTDDYLGLLSDFHKRFLRYVSQTISSKNISEEFVFFMNNSFKYIEESVEKYAKDEDRVLHIKTFEGRWLESLICYNFIMTFNYFSVDIIKICPICSSFFCHKGKYAKYCGESCKESGMKKK